MEQSISGIVEAVLEELEIPYDRESISGCMDVNPEDTELHCGNGGEVFDFIIPGESAIFPVKIIAYEEKNLLMTIGFFPVKVGERDLDRMYGLVNEINYNTRVGAYVVDPDDGELSFRIAHNVVGGAINQDVVRMCLLLVVDRLTGCYETIMAALFGGPRMTFTISTERDTVRS